MNLSYVLLLSVAVGLDSLFAGVAYGLKSIHMPFSSLAIVGIVTTVGATIAMGSARLLGQLIDSHITLVAGALLLIGIGLFNLLKVYLSNDAPAHDTSDPVRTRKLIFSLGGLVISVMAKPEAADLDGSKSISSGEAVLLSLALGVDNMAATFAANLVGRLPLYTPLVMGIIQMAFITAGDYGAGHLTSNRFKYNLPYLSGWILIALGLARLV
jgi:putative sporulation protein YtaF